MKESPPKYQDRSAGREVKHWVRRSLVSRPGRILFGLAMIQVFPGLSPFLPDLSPRVGSLVNQSFWLGLAVLSALVIYRHWTFAKVLLVHGWPIVLLLAWFGMSVLWSPFPRLSIQRYVILGIMSMTALAIVAARIPTRDLGRILLFVSAGALVVNASAVLVAPGVSLTAGGEFLGMHSHKNQAGAATALTFLVLLFAIPAGANRYHQIAAVVGAAVAAWFLVGTVSRTSIAVAFVAPVPVIAVFAALRLSQENRLMVTVVASLVVVCGLIGLALAGPASIEVGQFLFGDTTFTGRTLLWENVFAEIRERPIIGSAYGAFWYLEGQANRFYATDGGFLAAVGQAHNGYLDLVLQTGYIGLVLGLVAVSHLIVRATRYAHRMRFSRTRKWRAMLMASLVIFIVAHNVLESSLFRSGAPLGLVFMLLYFALGAWTTDRGKERKPLGRRPRRRGHTRSQGRHRSSMRTSPTHPAPSE